MVRTLTYIDFRCYIDTFLAPTQAQVRLELASESRSGPLLNAAVGSSAQAVTELVLSALEIEKKQ
jgi:hypothetical protein